MTQVASMSTNHQRDGIIETGTLGIEALSSLTAGSLLDCTNITSQNGLPTWYSAMSDRTSSALLQPSSRSMQGDRQKESAKIPHRRLTESPATSTATVSPSPLGELARLRILLVVS